MSTYYIILSSISLSLILNFIQKNSLLTFRQSKVSIEQTVLHIVTYGVIFCSTVYPINPAIIIFMFLCCVMQNSKNSKDLQKALLYSASIIVLFSIKSSVNLEYVNIIYYFIMSCCTNLQFKNEEQKTLLIKDIYVMCSLLISYKDIQSSLLIIAVYIAFEISTRKLIRRLVKLNFKTLNHIYVRGLQLSLFTLIVLEYL